MSWLHNSSFSQTNSILSNHNNFNNSVAGSAHVDGETTKTAAAEDSDQSLSVKCHCTKLKDKVTVVVELSPVEAAPTRNLYGSRRRDTPQLTTRKQPIRLVAVIDVSCSMDEPYGHESSLSKLERVKMFAELLVKTIGQDDHLSFVTFGTVAKVVVPLRRMTDEAKKEAITAVKSIEVGGVTNMSAGIFTAIDQFNVPFAKSRSFDDNVLLFTDGMANEGLTDSTELISEIRKRVRNLKEECHFEADYTVKFSTLGTGGFLPELLYDVGQAFSSDAFYFLDDSMNMELDLMTPLLLRQTTAVCNVHVDIEALNRVQLDRTDVTKEYRKQSGHELQQQQGDSTGAAVVNGANVVSDSDSYLIYDIATGLSRHILCRLKLPNKHKKILKGKDVLKITVWYKDPLMCSRVTEATVAYADLPAKDPQNTEPNLLAVGRQEIRLKTWRALEAAASAVARLDRSAARDHLRAVVDQLRSVHDGLMDDLEEDSRLEFTTWTDAYVANVEHCAAFIGDLAVRWDDVWGRVKALSSSVAREVPSTAGVCTPGAELFRAPAPMRERLGQVSAMLRDMYDGHGLATEVLDLYQFVVEELEEKIDEQSLYGQSFLQYE